MSKLIATIIALALGAGMQVTLAQNVDAQKDKAQAGGAANAQRPKPTANEAMPNGAAQSAKTANECDKLSGKEKDNCIQATPAGPVEMTTGQGSKGKSDIAKERDRNKAEGPTDAPVPAQSNDSLGHPQERATTGEAKPLREPDGNTGSNSTTPSGAGTNQQQR
jgi:hypothetical protein